MRAICFSCVLLAFIGCGRPYTVITTGHSHRYSGKAPAVMTELSLYEWIKDISDIYGDTLDEPVRQLWKRHITNTGITIESDTLPHPSNLFTALSLIKDLGYAVFSIFPANCEAVHAISILPVTLWALIMDFPPGSNPVQPEAVVLGPGQVLARNAERTSLRLIETTAWRENICRFHTTDMIVWETEKTSRIEGHIFGKKTVQGSGYYQIIALIGISRLPEHEFDAYLEEWFSRLPHTAGKAATKEFTRIFYR